MVIEPLIEIQVALTECLIINIMQPSLSEICSSSHLTMISQARIIEEEELMKEVQTTAVSISMQLLGIDPTQMIEGNSSVLSSTPLELNISSRKLILHSLSTNC